MTVCFSCIFAGDLQCVFLIVNIDVFVGFSVFGMPIHAESLNIFDVLGMPGDIDKTRVF